MYGSVERPGDNLDKKGRYFAFVKKYQVWIGMIGFLSIGLFASMFYLPVRDQDIVQHLNLEFMSSQLVPLDAVQAPAKVERLSSSIVDIVIFRHAEWTGEPGHHVLTPRGLEYESTIKSLYQSHKLITPDVIYTFKHPQFKVLMQEVEAITGSKRKRLFHSSAIDPNHNALETFTNDVEHGLRKFLFIWRHSQIRPLAVELGCNSDVCAQPWQGYNSLLHIQFNYEALG